MAMMLTGVAGPDSWCKRLGNFEPIVFGGRAAPMNPQRSERLPFLRHSHDSRGESARTRMVRTARAAALIFGLSAAIGLVWAPDAMAQMGGGMGGMGGHGNHGSHSNSNPSSSSNSSAAPGRTPNPLRAMLGEMKKLRGDLLLTGPQLETWTAAEDALRECVDLNRSRMPTPGSATSPDALSFAQELADNEHALADATAKYAAAMKTAMAALNSRQLQTTKDGLQSALDAETASVAQSQ